nr:DUF6271 family protein [Streptomyces sp. SID4948]
MALPTNRPCAETISAVHQEAVYAAENFGVEVHLLVLDSSEESAAARHGQVLRDLPAVPGVVAHHLGEAQQREFLARVIGRAGLDKPELLLDLMLPARLSYGACTNRAFLIAAALGCASVHRRDSDSRYQLLAGEPVFPIHHELLSLGERAADAAGAVTETALDARHADKPVSMVGSSFVGEMSVDIEEMYRIDPDVYYEVVGLWAPFHWSAQDKRQFADDSFRGAGAETFTRDHSVLTLVDPMRVDMCNIAFRGVHEQVPLMPATDTIGSDYFLIHLVHDATLPGVLHNRNIVNYYTGERRTDAGFMAYQMRFAKFFLSMLYLNAVYDRMEKAGEALLDERHGIRVPVIVDFLRESSRLDNAENVQRLDALDRTYRKLGGRYARFADLLAESRARLLDEARRDIEDFALLTETWSAMIRTSRTTGLYQLQRHPG